MIIFCPFLLYKEWFRSQRVYTALHFFLISLQDYPLLLWAGRDGLASPLLFFNPFKLIPEDPSGTQVIDEDTRWIYNKQMSLKEDKRKEKSDKNSYQWKVLVYESLESNTKVAFPCQIKNNHLALFFFLFSPLSITRYFSVHCSLVPNTLQLSQMTQIVDVIRNKEGKRDDTSISTVKDYMLVCRR